MIGFRAGRGNHDFLVGGRVDVLQRQEKSARSAKERDDTHESRAPEQDEHTWIASSCERDHDRSSLGSSRSISTPRLTKDDGAEQVSWLAARSGATFPNLAVQWSIGADTPLTVAGAARV